MGRAFVQTDQVEPGNRLVATALTSIDEATLRAMRDNFASVWNDCACPMTLKKRIARMLKPMSGAVAHKTALEGVELIKTMARRYGDDETARVLSKLGRRMGKGNRWNPSTRGNGTPQTWHRRASGGGTRSGHFLSGVSNEDHRRERHNSHAAHQGQATPRRAGRALRPS